MDPSKIDHERQARVSAEREARRVLEGRKRDMLNEIDDLEHTIGIFGTGMGTENARRAYQGLARLKKFVEDQ
ncbi:hypothetical protein HOU00_gp183 [Caulobacter phage CcrPW]|uniref:Uncharacterized protein n=1 Tax=Caulobacter phage CcrPW TaxID=2283271 RepID=A0A385EDL0_9CAUD|nr:hypothetical protein HOU00_gp183 [Caulobacter phage CcrPW]AXQ68942.1 hypothetical protein CcrPW_gp403 [Caulobacter phage CcrPW]